MFIVYSLSLPFFLCLSVSLSLFLSYTHTHTCARTRTNTYRHTHKQTHTHTRAHTYTYSLSSLFTISVPNIHVSVDETHQTNLIDKILQPYLSFSFICTIPFLPSPLSFLFSYLFLPPIAVPVDSTQASNLISLAPSSICDFVKCLNSVPKALEYTHILFFLSCKYRFYFEFKSKFCIIFKPKIVFISCQDSSIIML